MLGTLLEPEVLAIALKLTLPEVFELRQVNRHLRQTINSNAHWLARIEQSFGAEKKDRVLEAMIASKQRLTGAKKIELGEGNLEPGLAEKYFKIIFIDRTIVMFQSFFKDNESFNERMKALDFWRGYLENEKLEKITELFKWYYPVILRAKGKYGWTVLIWAAGKGQLDCLQALLAAGADKEAKDERGGAALICAAGKGQLDCLQALLVADANKEIKDKYGYTALICAAANGKLDCLQALLEAGANKDEKDNDGYTALMHAASTGKLDCLQALLDASADKDAKANDGRTALMHAAHSNKVDCIRVLLEAGADINAVDNQHKNALSWAQLLGHESCIQVLSSAHEAAVLSSNTANLSLAAPGFVGVGAYCAQQEPKLVMGKPSPKTPLGPTKRW